MQTGDAERIRRAKSPLERIELYVKFGERETDNAFAYVDPFIFGPNSPDPRSFSEIVASSACVWRGVIGELNTWEPINTKEKRRLKKLYKEVSGFRDTYCRYVIESREEVWPYRIYFTSRIQPVCAIMAEVERMMRKRLGEPAAYDKR
jgi:hypothetical protein